MLLLNEAIGENAVELEGAELDELAFFGPVDGGVVGDIAGCGDLDVYLETDWRLLQAVLEFLVVVIFANGCIACEIVVAGFGDDAIAPVARFACGVGEAECSDAEVGVAGEAGGKWLGCLNEAERGGMCAKKLVDRFG